MAYSLLEAYRELKEDITSIKRLRDMYKKIDNETFTKLLKLDPTYKDSDTQSGIYTNWILSKYNKGLIKDDSNVFGNFENTFKCLDYFNKNKTKFKNKDLNTYKDLDELVDAIAEVDATLPTKSQIKRTVKRTDINKDAPLFMETKNFKIYIPLTYEASCKLGTNTHWCTATRENNQYYIDYTSDGNKLYIMINKKDPNIKYQWNTERNYTCDADDYQIKLWALLARHEDLYDFYNKVTPQSITSGVKQTMEKYKLLLNSVKDGVFTCNSENIKYTHLMYSEFDEDEDPDCYYSTLSSKVKKVNLQSDVKEIPDAAFYNFRNLEDFTIPEGVTTIGRSFCDSRNIDTIVLPRSLSLISYRAFNSAMISYIYVQSDIKCIEENELENLNDKDVKNYSWRRVIVLGSPSISIWYYAKLFSVPDKNVIAPRSARYIEPNEVNIIKENAQHWCELWESFLYHEGTIENDKFSISSNYNNDIEAELKTTDGTEQIDSIHFDNLVFSYRIGDIVSAYDVYDENTGELTFEATGEVLQKGKWTDFKTFEGLYKYDCSRYHIIDTILNAKNNKK